MLRLRYKTEDWREKLAGVVCDACREFGMPDDERDDLVWDEVADQLCSNTLDLLERRGVEFEQAYQQSRGNWVIVQSGEPSEVEAFHECLGKAMEFAEKEVRELVEAEAKLVNEYEIGGLVVRMTAPQANRWNNGETTEDDLDAIKVFRPTTVGGRSYVRDGQIVMVQGMPGGEWLSAREAHADAELDDQLHGSSAVFLEGPVD